jgi:hypothetical protein
MGLAGEATTYYLAKNEPLIDRARDASPAEFPSHVAELLLASC